MRKVVLIILALILVCPTSGQDTVRIGTTDRLLSLLRPNIVMVLDSGIYDLTKNEWGAYNFDEYYEYNDKGLIVKNLSDFTLIGEGANTSDVRIVSNATGDNVIQFRNCSNISIENVRIGHDESLPVSTEEILTFDKATNISITNCTIHGPGTIGISASGTKNFKCTNTIIEKCSTGLLSFEYSINNEFVNCTFRNNNSEILINLKDCKVFTIDNCSFTNNSTLSSGSVMLNVVYSEAITIKNCSLINNEFDYFSNGKNLFKFDDNFLENNKFKIREYKSQ